MSLPSQTKIIISSRRKIDLPFSIKLDALTFDEYRTLISQELASTNTNLSDEIAEKLYQLTGGLPLAVRLATSLLKDYSMETVLRKFKKSDNSLFEFIIKPVINKYRNKYPYNKLLMTMAHLTNLATLPEIAHKAGLADNVQLVEEGLVNLTKESLLTKNDDKYLLHPLVRGYILSKEIS